MFSRTENNTNGIAMIGSVCMVTKNLPVLVYNHTLRHSSVYAGVNSIE